MYPAYKHITAEKLDFDNFVPENNDTKLYIELYKKYIRIIIIYEEMDWKQNQGNILTTSIKKIITYIIQKLKKDYLTKGNEK